MANNKHTTLMEVCVNPKLKTTVYKPIDDCVIGFDEKGNEIRVSTLLTFYYALNDKVSSLETSHNELVSKYNALLAAYKANTAKTAMQLLDIKENN